jgi:hypothetical protein
VAGHGAEQTVAAIEPDARFIVLHLFKCL